eukprot:COSAG02_NODE_15571_length_1159_cov_1.272642_2_plen_68_part_01
MRLRPATLPVTAAMHMRVSFEVVLPARESALRTLTVLAIGRCVGQTVGESTVCRFHLRVRVMRARPLT